MTAADKKAVKSAGEHWVCHVLSALGWGTALTRDGLERIDVLAAHPGSGRKIEVQVKATTNAQPSWMIGTKAQQPARGHDEWFVLVGLAGTPGMAPRSFIIPRDHVAAGAWCQFEMWRGGRTKLKTTVAGARPHAWVFAGYEDRWDLLDAPTTQVPILLAPELHPWAVDPINGLPASHPWHGNVPTW